MISTTNNTQITPAGEGFVKTATAAPDYQTTDLEGIPDNYSGPTITKKDYVFETITCTMGKATYIIIPPTAAISYYRPPGLYTPNLGAPLPNPTNFSPHYFPDAGQLFNGAGSLTNGQNSDVVAKGRLMLLAAELESTNNAFNQYGTISCWKTPLSRCIRPAGIATGIVHYTDNLEVNGCDGFTKVPLGSQAYVTPVKNGVYSVVMNREEEFLFDPVLDELYLDSSTTGQWGPGATTNTIYFEGCAPIWDNGFDSIVFRIDVPAATADQSFVLKVWKAFEYQPVFNSLLYDMSHLSPGCDLAALELYREVMRQLPMAVNAKDNPNFWTTVLNLVRGASTALSFIPGPVGTAAKGVHAVTSLFHPGNRGNGRTGRARPKKKKKVAFAPAQPSRRKKQTRAKRRLN